MSKVAIVGSRSAVSVDIASALGGVRPSEIISGGAIGVDTLAAEYAQREGIKLSVYPPDYERYGRRAPHVRNRQMMMDADLVLAFWDGESRGTLSSINQAKRLGTPLKIIRI